MVSGSEVSAASGIFTRYLGTERHASGITADVKATRLTDLTLQNDSLTTSQMESTKSIRFDYKPLSLKPKDEEVFLEGPRTRWFEFFFALRVLKDFIRGFRALHFVGPCITVFGSARFKEDHEYYKKAYAVGKKLAEAGVTVMTGGGPGIMEAANRGAYENGGISVGCNIDLPLEQSANLYMHRWVNIKYFFVRKVLLVKYSFAFVVMPGGLGTMDEFFETLTLIQTGIIKNFPVILIGKAYFEPLDELLRQMVKHGTISEKDLNLVLLTDDIDEAGKHVQEYVMQNYKVSRIKPSRWLRERIIRSNS
jgi:hypothetical protein